MSKELKEDLREYLSTLTQRCYDQNILAEKSEEVSGENNPLAQFLKGGADSTLEIVKELYEIIGRYEYDEEEEDEESEYDL